MHKIETIRISVSETCFFKCKTCFFWKNQKKIESIDLDVYDKFFSSIAKIKGQKTYVHISGGEPLLIKNIFSFISLLKKHGLYTKINTNGWLLNKRNIEMLFDAGIDEITLSLDGSCPEIHDYIRGMPGSFNKVIKGIKEINDYSVKTKKKVEIHITTTVCSLNFDDIISIVNLIQKLNYVESIWLQAISAPFFAEFFLDSSYNPKKWYEYKQFQELWPTNKKKLLDVYTQLIYLKKQNYKIGNSEFHLKKQYNYFSNPEKRMKDNICNVINDINIDNRGNIFPCLNNTEIGKLGNIYSEQDIAKIFESETAQLLRNKMLLCNKICHQTINCKVI